MSRQQRSDLIPTEVPAPLKRGRRPKAESDSALVWYSGAWRTLEGVEAIRARIRLRQRARRANGTAAR